MPRSRPVLLSLAFALAACTSAPSAESPKAAATASPLIGAWDSRVQFTSGAFTTMKGLRFAYVFNAGGTMTESSNYDGAPPVPPAYGIWREVGPNKFEVKYLYYSTRPPATFQDITSGGGWMPAGHGILTESITLAADGNSFDSTIHYEAFDIDGKPATGGGDATGHATRLTF